MTAKEILFMLVEFSERGRAQIDPVSTSSILLSFTSSAWERRCEKLCFDG